MKFATYRYGGVVRAGAASKGRLIDVSRAYDELLSKDSSERPLPSIPSDVIKLVSSGPATLKAAAEAVSYVEAQADLARLERDGLSVAEQDVTFLPAIANSPKVLCVARNYARHAAEGGQEVTPIPVFFARFPIGLVGHRQPMVRPKASDQLDWEGEMAVVIGKRCRHVRPAEAFDVVAGYTIFNDGSVRDFQRRGGQYTAGKNFMGTGPLGPYIVTKDEVTAPGQLAITLTVNGVVMQNGNTSEMVFDVPELIASASEFIELEPGDLICTGTPDGVGTYQQPPVYLKPGDVVRVEVTGLGALENPVVQEA